MEKSFFFKKIQKTEQISSIFFFQRGNLAERGQGQVVPFWSGHLLKLSIKFSEFFHLHGNIKLRENILENAFLSRNICQHAKLRWNQIFIYIFRFRTTCCAPKINARKSNGRSTFNVGKSVENTQKEVLTSLIEYLWTRWSKSKLAFQMLVDWG